MAEIKFSDAFNAESLFDRVRQVSSRRQAAHGIKPDGNVWRQPLYGQTGNQRAAERALRLPNPRWRHVC